MILIQNGCIVDPKTKTEYLGDIVIEEEKIKKISKPFEEKASDKFDRVIDATGCYVLPGLVDIHSHFRDPGQTQKEDVESGCKAALAGGYTSIVMMANTVPPVDNKKTLQYLIEKAKEAPIHLFPTCTVTKKMEGKKNTDFAKLFANGAVGFTDDGVPVLSEEVLRKAFLQAGKLDVPVSLHEEDPDYIGVRGLNAGKVAAKKGVRGADRMAEYLLIERDIRLANETGAKVNFQHLSARESIDLIREAKKTNPNLFAEATPHHIELTEEAVDEFGTNAKMNPPLRAESDRQAIVRGLLDGTVDCIATDHAPHTKEEKERDFKDAPSGIIGLETALPICYEVLVEQSDMSMVSLMEKMSLNPAILYKLDAGYVAESGPADLCIFDAEKWEVKDSFQSKASNSPFVGRELHGVVRYTICKGKVFERGMEVGE